MMNSKAYNGKYLKASKLGSGSFGCVYLVQDTTSQNCYAMKKFYLDNLKPNCVEDQYKLIKAFSHINIIEVIECFNTKGNHYLITNYYPNNLYDFVKKNLNEKAIKGIMKQLFEGVGYLHERNYVHRDIKPDNILISSDGIIKMTDFDLTKELVKDKSMSRNVVTLYYRAPEIFFGDVHYGIGIDLWSLGCLMGELVLGSPLFKGSCELETLGKIMDIVGCPTEENWPGVSQLPNYLPYAKCNCNLMEILQGKISENGIDLIIQLLSLDPAKRLSCQDALKHKFFTDISKIPIATKEDLKSEMNLK